MKINMKSDYLPQFSWLLMWLGIIFSGVIILGMPIFFYFSLIINFPALAAIAYSFWKVHKKKQEETTGSN